MNEPEQTLAIVLTVEEERFFKTYFDVILTDRRFLFIHKKSRLQSTGALAGYFALGLPGIFIGALAKRPTKIQGNKESDNLPSYEDLLGDNKKNYAVSYENIEWFRLIVSKSDYCKMIFKANNKTRTFYLTDESAEQLSNILPKIVALNKKRIK